MCKSKMPCTFSLMTVRFSQKENNKDFFNMILLLVLAVYTFYLIGKPTFEIEFKVLLTNVKFLN